MRSTGLSPGYWRLWSAALLSNVADGIRLGALPLLAAAITRDPTLIAGLAVAQRLPWGLAFLAGLAADRVDRRRLLWMVNASRAALLVPLTVTAVTGTASLPLLYGIVLLIGAGEVVYDNASQVVIPALAPADKLERANGLLAATEIAANEFVGPPAGSALFVAASALPFATNTGMLAITVGVLLTLPAIPSTAVRAGGPRPTLRHDLAEGVAWLARHPLLRSVTVLGGIVGLVNAASMAVLVLYALERLGVREALFGVLLAATAVGGVIGSLLVERVARWVGGVNGLALCLVLDGVATLGLGLTNQVLLATGFLGLMGVGYAGCSVQGNSLRQRLVPGDLLGRVISVHRTVAVGAAPLGAILGGVAARQFGVRSPYLLGGAGLLVAGLIGLVVLSRQARSDPVGPWQGDQRVDLSVDDTS
jgi:MFS family permease